MAGVLGPGDTDLDARGVFIWQRHGGSGDHALDCWRHLGSTAVRAGQHGHVLLAKYHHDDAPGDVAGRELAAPALASVAVGRFGDWIDPGNGAGHRQLAGEPGPVGRHQ